MHLRSRLSSGISLVLVTVTVFAAGAATAQAPAAAPDPVMPVRSHPLGHSYGEWSALWWQWAYSMPVQQHPLFDNADCSKGQTGRVWFLGGAFQFDEAPNGDVVADRERQCTVPKGTFLFIPIINAEAATLEGNGTTEEALRSAAASLQDAAQNMTMSIDGAPVANIDDYRVQSPLFTYGPLPDDNVLQFFGLDAPAGATSLAVGDGVYVMVRPLRPGTHTIEFHGEVPSFRLFLDISYEITVV
jgi:hypothetical protein